MQLDDLVDILQERGHTPAWFGLGFIQVKVSAIKRYHFWHPELTANVAEEDIHDHRYGFTSTIYRGQMIQEYFDYKLSPDGSHELYDVSCDSQNPGPVGPAQRVDVIPSSTVTLKEMSRHTLPQGSFHRVSAELCVTQVLREIPAVPLARVIRPVGAPHVCPFAKTYSEDFLWKLADEAMRFSI